MEVDQWISKVNVYVDVIANQIRKESVFWWKKNDDNDWDNLWTSDPEPDYDKAEEDFYKYRSEVSYIHTGSIPSQFGKPLMTLSELSPSFVR